MPKASAITAQDDSNKFTEGAWLEVIEQMEHAYTQLINHQVELEQKNRELEEVNQLISSVQRSMTEVLLVTDLSGKVIQVNHSLEQLANEKSAQLNHQDVSVFFSDDDQATIAYVHQQKEFSQHEVTFKFNNSNYPIILNGSRLLDANQQVQGMVLVGREISDLRLAYKKLAESHQALKTTQEQLVNAEKMASLGRLVAGVAHELNNPISFIYGNTHALMSYAKKLIPYLTKIQFENANDPQNNNEVLESEHRKITKILADLPSLLDGTLEGVERVRDIVLDLLQFSSGQQYEFKRFDLIHAITTTLRWVNKEHNVEVSCQLPNHFEIEGQPGRIQQVIMNLIQNALDALEEIDNAQLSVSLTHNNEHCELSIKDNGLGIEESILPHIFEPFVTTKDTGKGTGLGLSLSYRFISDHGGSLTAHNHSDGGAEFILKLPLTLSASTTMQSEQNNAYPS